jgi:hypothetical protein
MELVLPPMMLWLRGQIWALRVYSKVMSPMVKYKLSSFEYCSVEIFKNPVALSRMAPVAFL